MARSFIENNKSLLVLGNTTLHYGINHNRTLANLEREKKRMDGGLRCTCCTCLPTEVQFCTTLRFSISPKARWFGYRGAGMDPATYFRGGARRNFTEFSTRSVAFWSVASRFDVSWASLVDFWNALFTKIRHLMSYKGVYCAKTDKVWLKS